MCHGNFRFREIRLRCVATRTPERQQLLDQLVISVPAHLERNAEWGADFVTSWANSPGFLNLLPFP